MGKQGRVRRQLAITLMGLVVVALIGKHCIQRVPTQRSAAREALLKES